MEEKLKNIISKVLNTPKEKITIDASPETISNWDSLRHMQLIIALEEEFGVTFNDEQILDMMNYQALLAAIKGK